jgi:hypothetical protein
LALANDLCLLPVEGGWAIALKHEKGEPEQLSFPFDCMETAQQFLSIANYDLGFIPSILPEKGRIMADRLRATSGS